MRFKAGDGRVPNAVQMSQSISEASGEESEVGAGGRQEVKPG